MSFIKQFIRKNFLKKKCMNSGNCPEKDKCKTLLNLLLDGEANKDEEKYLIKHLDSCIECYHCYELEKTIKEALKSRIKNEPLPQDLANNIKLRIKELD